METLGWIFLIVAIITIALWIYAIADIIKGTFNGSGTKLLWLVVVIIFPILGAFLYLIIGKRG